MCTSLFTPVQLMQTGVQLSIRTEAEGIGS